MAEYILPKRGVAFITYMGLVSQADTKLLIASPTLAAGDFKISKDGGATANLATLPTNTPAASSQIKISLSATEMEADNVSIIGIDAAGAEWCSFHLNIQTSTRAAEDLAFPTTSGRSIDVAATGEVGLDFTNRLDTTGILPNVVAGGAGGLFIAGSNAATTISGLTTGALSCTTITASGAVAFQSTFAVTTSTSLAALSATTVTFSGAVAFQSTFAVTTSTNLAALSCTTLTASGAVAFQSTFGITGASTFTGAITATNAANNVTLGTFTVTTNAIAWNASWDAEVESEATDALNAYDPPTRAEATTDVNSVLAQLPSSPLKNTAFTYVIKMVLASDHVTPATGLTVSMTRSLDGAAFGAATGTVTEISTGHYSVAASQADMNGDMVTHRFTAATADDLTMVFMTVS